MDDRIAMRRLESSGENMDGFLALLIMMVFIFCAAWYVCSSLSEFMPSFSHRKLFSQSYQSGLRRVFEDVIVDLTLPVTVDDPLLLILGWKQKLKCSVA
jgi:hypothetical protein